MKRKLRKIASILIIVQVITLPVHSMASQKLTGVIYAKAEETESANDDYSTGDIEEYQINLSSENSVIQVDGLYSDWTGIPHTGITWYSPDHNQVHLGALYRDGDILYGHYKMNDAYQTHMAVTYIELTINGSNKVDFMIQGKNASNEVDWNMLIQDLPKGVTRSLGVFHNQNHKQYMGDANFTVYDTRRSIGDECEFAIDLNVISKITGIPVENMREFTMYNPNIGRDAITIAGSSTGVIMGLAMAVTISGGSLLFYKKKKRVES